MRYTLFLVITQQVVVNRYRSFGATYRFHILENGTDRLSRNVSKELTLLAA